MKTEHAFINHIQAIRNKTNYHGLLTKYDLKLLSEIYFNEPLDEFKKLATHILMRIKEERS